MGLSSFVHLAAQVEGLHHWPAAGPPEQYLRAPHRHLFIVTADIEVFSHDREIEINAAARWLTARLPTLADQPGADLLDFGPQSCERLAARITEAIRDRYGPRRRIRCMVAEDGILGAGVTWHPGPGTEPGA
jgi:hypothetical protein